MEPTGEFGRYLGHICASLGRAQHKAGLQEYTRGLMLPLKRKSIEPLAAALDPYHVPALHQSLHHFVATSPWEDEVVLGAVQSWVLPKMAPQPQALTFLIADDSGMPKQGTHSVGVARQYVGQDRQLPGRGQSVARHRAGQPADQVSLVSSRILDRRPDPLPHRGGAGAGEIRHQAADFAGTDQGSQASRDAR